MTRLLTLLLTAGTLALLVETASAHPSLPIVEGRAVAAYGDLDLRNASDAREMLSRIDRAAKVACGGMPERNSLYRSAPEFMSRAYAACRQRAVAKAVADLSAPQVSHAYAEVYRVPAVRVAQP